MYLTDSFVRCSAPVPCFHPLREESVSLQVHIQENDDDIVCEITGSFTFAVEVLAGPDGPLYKSESIKDAKPLPVSVLRTEATKRLHDAIDTEWYRLHPKISRSEAVSKQNDALRQANDALLGSMAEMVKELEKKGMEIPVKVKEMLAAVSA
jgi:hypothetical protein